MGRVAWLCGLLAVLGCGGSGGSTGVMDLDSDLATSATFWDLPFPSDLRLTDGHPDMTGFETRDGDALLVSLRDAAMERAGWPQIPVIYFRFTEPLAQRVETDLIPAAVDAPIMLLKLDDGSQVPVVARTLEQDVYSPDYLLAVAPRPGFVLEGGTTYAVVVKRAAGDAAGRRLRPAAALGALAAGRTPAGARGAAAAALYAPLFARLGAMGVPAGDVAAATVFTTGDVAAELAAVSDGLLARDAASIANPRLVDPDGVQPDFCEVELDLTLPQYLTGVEPWNTGGEFVIGADGLPVQQGERTVPAVVTIPRQEMPAAGFPLLLYFHGSGGVHDEVVDASRSPAMGVDGPPGQGPAMYYARIGFAAAGSAHPVSPERVPGASDIAYINFNNLAVFPRLYRQGVIEQRMYLTALLELELSPDVLNGCDGAALPTGATAFRFDPDQVYAGGQSQGGLYTNLVGAVDPRPRAFVPTGAGGFWSILLTTSRKFAEVTPLLNPVMGTNVELSFLHPALHLIEIAWEPAEGVVYSTHLGRRPLPGRSSRPVYEPVGYDDGYFAPPIYEAMALAYGHEEAGEVVWPGLQDALALDGRGGVLDYPVANNLTSPDGSRRTGVVVAYRGDGNADPHSIYRQLDAVIYQYQCFLDTMRRTGTAVVPAPAPLGTPCPEP